MTELKTRDSVLKALEAARHHRPTPEELHRQRVSFIFGSLKDSSNVTRERIESILASKEGKRAGDTA